jgi:hypothetical protein
MKNVEITIEGSILTAKIDMSKSFGPSTSGKTTIIASTEGNQTVTTVKGKPVVLGLNVYSK